MKVFNVIANALFPCKCYSCGRIIGEDEHLCEYCYEMLEYIETNKHCIRCGAYKKNCECNNRVFHFERVVAPFINDGVAKNAMYRYKFGRISSNTDFFAEEMAKTVRMVYNDINFDGIVYVPMHPLKKLRRGFNQSQLLANGLSKILKLDIFEDLLSCKYNKKSQHDMPFNERFQNIKGMYNFNYRIEGKTVLLVDDIKTTGASLDECAKQLLLAGAEHIYCITGLITVNKKGKK